MSGVGRKFGGGSGGAARRKPAEYHYLAGNYRPSLHGPLPAGLRTRGAVTAARPAPAIPLPAIPLPAIPQTGAELIARMLREFSGWSPSELVTLDLAAEQWDRARALRKQIVEAGGRGDDTSRLERAARAAATLFATLVKSLKLREGA